MLYHLTEVQTGIWKLRSLCMEGQHDQEPLSILGCVIRTFGHRMMGTTPIVTKTENSPSTMDSTAACTYGCHFPLSSPSPLKALPL